MPQFGITSKFAEDTFYSCILNIDKNTEENWTKNWILGALFVTSCQPDTAPFAATLCDLPSEQLTTYHCVNHKIQELEGTSRDQALLLC